MKHFRLVLFCCLVSPPLQAQNETQVATDVLFLHLKGIAGVDQDRATLIENVIVTELSNYKAFNILSRANVMEMLDAERLKDMMNCDDASCMAQIAGALGTELLIAGDFGNLSRESSLLSLRMITSANGRVLSRVSLPLSGLGGELIPQIHRAVAQLIAGYDPNMRSSSCRHDEECSTGLRCESGYCLATSAPAASNHAWRAPTSREQPWADTAAVVGFTGAGLTAAFATAAYLTAEDVGTAVALGGVATLVAGVTGPVTAAGADSARARGAYGNQVFQTVGWVAYTVSMLNAVTLITWALASDAGAPAYLTLTTGAMGSLGLVLFAVDAKLAGNELRQRSGQERKQSGLKMTPVVQPIVTTTSKFGRQVTGAVAGIRVAF